MNELVHKTPFHCIITGPTNCGKTRYLVDQLRGPFRYVFEYIVLICPTYIHNKTYEGFARGDPRFFVFCPNDFEEIEELLQACSTLFNVAKCNLGKVNLETMLASDLPSCATYYAGVPMGWQGLHVLSGFLADRCGSLLALVCWLIIADHCSHPPLPLW